MKKKKLKLIALGAVIVIAVIFVRPALQVHRFKMTTPAGADNLYAKSKQAAELDEQVLFDADCQKAAMEFQLNLLRAASAEGQNKFLSPLSVGIALTMVANGAEGDTLLAFENVLGMQLSQLNQFYGAMQKKLSYSKDPTILNVANAVFFDKSRLSVSKDYIDDCSDYFSTGFFSLDFFSPQAIESINQWAYDNTNGKIQKMINSISHEQIMFIANAVYFEGKWVGQFDPSRNYQGAFATSSGDVNVKYMKRALTCRYYYRDDAAAAILPYKGNEYSFVAIMPTDNFDAWIDQLTPEGYLTIIKQAQASEITVGLPKFEASFDYQLAGPLGKIGLGLAFDSHQANFTRIGTAIDNIFLVDVPHKTYLKIDEEGTIAVAITMPSVGCTSASPTEVIFDKTFLYAIIENESGLPIFLGVMDNPAK